MFLASSLTTLGGLNRLARVTIIAALLGTAYSTYTLYLWYRLSHVPGPRWAGFTILWMVRKSSKGQQATAMKEVTDKYGSLARVGPNELVTDDPEVMRKMMAVRSKYTRGMWYDAMRFDPVRDNLFSMRDEEAHNQLRKKMAAGYSGKQNTSMEETIETAVAQLIKLVESYAVSVGEHRPMDMSQKIQYFALDAISDLAFGKAFGYLERDEDVFSYIGIAEQIFPTMHVLSNLPQIPKILHSPLFRGLMPKESDKLGFGAFIGVTNKVVAERYAPGAPELRDMLGSFMRSGLEQAEAAGEALLQVVAGADTSSSTIRVLLLGLMTTPSAYRRLQAEIDDGIRAGGVSSPIRDAEARQMPYLQACIRESLRFMPPATAMFFKQVPPGGDIIDGKFVPGGTQVGSSSLGMHRSKRIFGPDADVFVPERWLVDDAARISQMTSTVDLVFHSGKWQCLGKPVALMEFNKVIVELLRRYDFAIADPLNPLHIRNTGIWMMSDFWVRVSRRESSD